MPPVSVAVVGGGPAGMTAAIFASAAGADVTLFERGDRLGRKLGITGKGRCNLTNNCAPDEFLRSVPTNPRFLYSALYAFPPQELMTWVESLGVPLKTERGNRVFPVSDRASDVVNALRREVGRSCRIARERVTGISTGGGELTGLRTAKGEYGFDRVIIATGGLSYPMTGSDGDGLRFAEELGLEVVPPTPALVPLETVENWCAEAMGLSLRNTGLKVTDAETGKTVYEDFGEMMFTHFGVSGPMILSASSYLPDIKPGKYRISLDLKPALDMRELDARILSDFAKYANRDFINSLGDLLPAKLIPVIVKLSDIDPHRKVNSITKTERAALVALLKGLTCTVKRTRPIAEAIVTSGGVKVSELNPRTMECKKIRGLYFAGEVIDVDAYTGGFNLHIAFCTGRAAGIAAAEN
jgi:predicted Rossmann fold flavoprotein